ncbi:MAG: ABC transporter permease [Clostridia bacterium]|nr:ABC transporter permease [Clostridia bacterium]
MSSILAIIQKELKRIFTDRRLILALFLPGIMIYIMYSLMGSFMINQSDTPLEARDYYIYTRNAPEEFSSFFTSDEYHIYHVNEIEWSDEEILQGIENGLMADLFLVYSDDFYPSMLAYDALSGEKAPSVSIYYNSAKENSQTVYSVYTIAMNQFEQKISNKFDLLSVDKATESDVTMFLFSSILPMLLLTFLFTGCMSVCTESVAGEKERGTIANLLITPIRRSDIALGKIIALGLASLISATVSFLGTMLSLPKLMGQEFTLEAYHWSTYLMLLLVILSTVLLFTTLLTIVSTYAKTAKEATGLASPIMIVVMMVGLLGLINLGENQIIPCFIPIYNSMVCFKSILQEDISSLRLALTVLANFCYVGLGVFGLTKMFQSERIMFKI